MLGWGSAVSPGVALSYLEEAIGATCRQGMLHFTPAVVAGLQAFPIEGGGDRSLVTANGTPVVSGDGYIGVEPQVAPSCRSGRVVGVRDRTGAGASRPGRELPRSRRTWTVEDNVVTYRAERYALAIWDGIDEDELAAAAVLVDWAT